MRDRRCGAPGGADRAGQRDARRRTRVLPRAAGVLAVCCVLAAHGPAGAADEAPAVRLPAIEVVASSPIPGTGTDPDRVPAGVLTLDRALIERLHPLTLPDLLEQRVGSITINDLQNNPFQPDVQYRGFTASPLLGNPQGLAVFQNGVRVNEPFGETVNWDLIPDFAIERVDLLPSSNPVFGLNALGGALALRMRTGFTFDDGADLAVSGGSFARRDGVAQGARVLGPLAVYAGARWFAEDGWRDHSPSEVRQLFADLAWRGASAELGASLTAADNSLTGNGVAPVELLAVDRAAVFTWPDRTDNRAAALALRGAAHPGAELTVEGTAYAGGLRRRTLNGDAFDAEACDADPAILCLGEDGPVLRDQDDATIDADLLDDDAGALNRSSTDSVAFGGALQAVLTRALLGRPNQALLGVSFDGGRAAFESSTELGALTPSRTVAGFGLVVSAGNEVQPVDLDSRNQFYGVFFHDVLSITESLALTVSGRFNRAEIVLRDQLGTALDGEHTYQRFNPGVGATWALAPAATLYAGYASANRAPSAAELGCADPDAPCRLPNAFVSDPPLDQVVAHTLELGARGGLGAARDLPTRWRLGLYRTTNDDDIIFVASEGFGRGYFRNAGTTRRQGLELDLGGTVGRVDWYLSYGLLDTTFRDALTLPSPNNPAAAANGTIQVEPGDDIPGLPKHQLKVGLSVDVTAHWRIGGSLVFASEQYLRGDEANLDDPVPGYWLVNLFTRYAVRDWLEVFVQIENAFDEEYATFGTYTETDEVFLRQVPDASNPRAFGPGGPIGAFGGIRVRL